MKRRVKKKKKERKERKKEVKKMKEKRKKEREELLFKEFIVFLFEIKIKIVGKLKKLNSTHQQKINIKLKEYLEETKLKTENLFKIFFVLNEKIKKELKKELNNELMSEIMNKLIN